MAATCTLALLGLTACQTTQQTAQLKAIASTRQISSDGKVVVTRPGGQITVSGATLIKGKDSEAIAVDLKNTSGKPVNDMPISVGVDEQGKRTILNEKPGSYFKNHAPALAPGASTTFVFTTEDKLKSPTKPFAIVGSAAKKLPTVAKTIPDIDVKQIGFKKTSDGDKVTVELHNGTPLPQYAITAYAWAKKGGRVVAAGRSGEKDLGTGETDTVTITFVGNPTSPDSIQLDAPATIFNKEGSQ